jgi:hypothetical protein
VPVPPLTVPSAIRSAPAARPPSPNDRRTGPGPSQDVTPEELERLRQALRSLPYEDYLQTPWWRARRNRALALAGYRCQRCPAKRNLEVHHRTYERIGAELDDDLEVVCRGCHEGEHFNQTQDGIAVYVRIVSEVLREIGDAHFSDIVEAAKCRCATLRIPYHGDRLHAAIARLVPRFPFRPAASQAALYDVAAPSAPLSRAEASGALGRLMAASAIKLMPNARPRTLREVEHHKAARILAQAIVWQAERCDELERAVEPSGSLQTATEETPVKTWQTAALRRWCGFDPAHIIEKGEAYLEIDDGARKRVRCSKCADRYADRDPDALAATVVPPPASPQAPPSTVVAESEPEPELEGEPW